MLNMPSHHLSKSVLTDEAAAAGIWNSLFTSNLGPPVWGGLRPKMALLSSLFASAASTLPKLLTPSVEARCVPVVGLAAGDEDNSALGLLTEPKLMPAALAEWGCTQYTTIIRQSSPMRSLVATHSGLKYSLASRSMCYRLRLKRFVPHQQRCHLRQADSISANAEAEMRTAMVQPWPWCCSIHPCYQMVKVPGSTAGYRWETRWSS